MTKSEALDMADRITVIRNDVAIIDAALHAPEMGEHLDKTAACGLRYLCERIMGELSQIAENGIKPAE
jgi:hypothetical protein